MTAGYGIKISRPGFDVNTATPQQLAFSSQYQTFRIHAQGNDTLTDSARTVTIPHNLGYVPFFLVHTQLDSAVATNSVVGDNTDYFISPFRIGSEIDVYEAENTHDIIAWADNTNLYVRARSNVGKYFYPIQQGGVSSQTDQMGMESDLGYTAGDWYVGNNDPIFNVEKGAVRTQGGVTLDQSETVYSATLNLYIGDRLGSGQVKMIVYGIDEDNTSSFNGGTPATARAKTTASVSSNSTLSQGNGLGVNVKTIVEEIIGRAGWSSGNRIGFIMDDNGTAAGNEYGEFTDSQSTLEIMRSSTLANFKYTIFLNQVE
jgi:hypothetical protein